MKNGVLQKIDPEWFRKRLLVLMLLVVLLFVILAARLFYLQILKGEHYRELSSNNCLRKQRIEALRGLIYDRNGHLLVDNRPSYDLQIIPNDLRPIEETAQRLSQLTDLKAVEIESLVRSNRGPYGYAPVVVKKDITRDLMAVLLSHSYELPGVTIATGARRNYIYEPLAAHLIGYLGEISERELKSKKFPHKRGGDMVGRFGAEKAFENELSGVPGVKVVQVNATGRVVRVLDKQPAQPGHNLFLTIDFQLQQKAESLLNGKTGAIVAMDPENGDVLAMASSPVFSQNAFINGLSGKQWRSLMTDQNHPLRNKAIQGEYPPASTYKIITAMAALEEGVMNRNTTVYCPGHLRFGNRLYRCWKDYGHGEMDMIEAIEQSCDVFFYQAGKALGVDRIARYAKGSGLGEKTGMVLANEEDGLIPTSDWKRNKIGIPWQPGENLSIAIGQGYNLVTPLQMAVLTAAVANNGTVYKPNIMEAVKSVKGGLVEKSSPQAAGKLPVSQESLEIIKKGLYNAVNNKHGTAYWYARSEEIPISGKTGTAQLVGRRSDDLAEGEEFDRKHLPHAWFVGYAPSHNPRIAVSVLIEHGEGGASAAGPVAKEMMLTYLNTDEEKGSAKEADNQE
ncbi:MAG: penicillin-binding protein 2 [Desulfobacteraceae bacterium]|nr:penicillin-binding protein 2 [Desulfobacteraceae bacterium]MCF8094039.1 penicillin-binding protein 2 [Desulfobacteraceae bacterium]